MLSEERIVEIKNKHFVMDRYGENFNFIDFARAIEAAVLPEGLVAVPKEPTLAMLGCLRSDITSNLEKRYQAMLAAAPKAQASPLDLMECLQDRPVEPSKAVQGKCVVQAEEQGPFPFSTDRVAYHKTAAIGVIMPCGTMVTNVKEAYEAGQKVQAQQEPVKDAPVAWRFSKGTITKLDSCPHGGNWQPLYIHPQPDLTAEVEFMQGKYEEMLEEWLPQKQRIAALEEAAREARDALLKYQQRQSYADLVYAESVGDEALAKLDAVLGDALAHGPGGSSPGPAGAVG